MSTPSNPHTVQTNLDLEKATLLATDLETRNRNDLVEALARGQVVVVTRADVLAACGQSAGSRVPVDVKPFSDHWDALTWIFGQPDNIPRSAFKIYPSFKSFTGGMF